MEELLQVGVIANTHGLQGEVKVFPTTDDVKRFKKLREAWLDTGAGIPEEALAHLTEAFYRVDKARSRQQGGFGLGLALCQEIAAFHNGSIQFANRADVPHGACVTVELRGGRP